MKKAVHPQVFADAKATCTACGAVFLIPSTVKEVTIEICRMCHPVYTGKKQGEARGGRIERFRKRMAAGKETTKTKAKKK
ncbi:50S ribosomal protein L31 [Candidatus Peregrinibacteria bacterium CG1_02_54_53]|nr:MAG: 50S ribosomal protein L31 [Candidatus Peregrinibacteria bacterium CG1_02_54_53]